MDYSALPIGWIIIITVYFSGGIRYANFMGLKRFTKVWGEPAPILATKGG
jgi:hypothetical protein